MDQSSAGEHSLAFAPSVRGLPEVLEEYRALRAALRGLRRGAARGRGGAGGAADVLDARPCCPAAERCSPEGLRRLGHVCGLEAHYPPAFDHAALVIAGCRLLERELVRLVAEPARRLGPVLLQAVADGAGRAQGEILEKWLAGRAPTTLGTLEMILFALRRGLGQGLPEVDAFLRASFRPGYADLLATNGPGRCLARLRQDYRNPAAHGDREIDHAGYRQFCRLSVGHVSFREWTRSGPEPAPPDPAEALLHHHLDYLPDQDPDPLPGGPPPPEDSGRVRLLRLRTPSGSGLRVRVRVRPGGRLRVGEHVHFALEVNAPCRALLVSLPEDGPAAVLFPNRYRPNARLTVGVHHVPDSRAPECAFPLEGPAGTETVLALATHQPLGLSLLPEGEERLRFLSAVELTDLARLAEALPPEGWAVGVCHFEVRV